MPRRTKDEAEKTRQALLRAAEHKFFEKGVVSTSLQEIAKAAGLTRGAIYWHFKDKAELLRALSDNAFLPHERLLEDLAQQDLSDPLDALCANCCRTLDSILNDPHRRRLLTILTRRCEYLEELQALIVRNNSCRDKARAVFETILEKARRKEKLGPGWTPKTAALAMQSMIIGFVFTEMDYARPSRSRDAARTEAVRAFFKSLGA